MNIITCKWCGKEFKDYQSNKRKFCSSKCHYGSRGTLYKYKKNVPQFECMRCGKLVSAYKSEKSKYCSRECHHKHRSVVKLGSKSSAWKGGRIVDTNGYVSIMVESHPRTCTKGRTRYVLEHILVLEGDIGKQISRKVHCHHIDEDRSNNSPLNLVLLTPKLHKLAHKYLKDNEDSCFNHGLNNHDYVDAGGSSMYSRKVCKLCGYAFSVKRHLGTLEFTTDKIKEERKKYAKDILQPRRETEPSLEFIKTYPDQAKKMFTPKEIRGAKEVWK